MPVFLTRIKEVFLLIAVAEEEVEETAKVKADAAE